MHTLGQNRIFFTTGIVSFAHFTSEKYNSMSNLIAPSPSGRMFLRSHHGIKSKMYDLKK